MLASLPRLCSTHQRQSRLASLAKKRLLSPCLFRPPACLTCPPLGGKLHESGRCALGRVSRLGQRQPQSSMIARPPPPPPFALFSLRFSPFEAGHRCLSLVFSLVWSATCCRLGGRDGYNLCPLLHAPTVAASSASPSSYRFCVFLLRSSLSHHLAIQMSR